MYKERKSPWVKERKFARGSTYWTDEAEREKKIREEEREYYRHMTSIYASMNI